MNTMDQVFWGMVNGELARRDREIHASMDRLDAALAELEEDDDGQ